MWYFLREFAIPFLIAALLGLFLGWLLWRWRRRGVDSARYDQLVRSEGEYKTQIASLTGRQKTLEDKLSMGSARIATLETDAAQLGEYQTLSGTLRTDLDAAEASRVQLAGQFDASEKDRAKLTADLDASERARLDLQKKLDASAQARADLEANLGNGDATLTDLRTKFDAVQQDRVELQAQLQRAEASQASLRAEHNATITKVASLEEDSSKLSALEVGLAAATAKLATSNRNESSLQERSDELSSELSSAQSRIADLEGRLGDAEAERAELQTASAAGSEAQDLVGVLRTQLATANARTNELETAKAAADADAASRAQSLAGELSTSQARVKELEAAKAAADADAASRAQSLAGELSTSQARVKELEAAKAAADADAASRAQSLAGELSTSQARVKELEAAKAATEADGRVRTQGLQVDLDKARQAQTAAEGQASELSARLTAAATEIDRNKQTSAQLQSANSDLAKLRAQLNNTEGRVGSLTGDVTTRNQRITELEAQLAAAMAVPTPAPAPAAAPVTTLAGLSSGNWQQGTTKLGTPGANHSDDLKEVNGIGPKMEGLLNDFGITSWEQLAAFTEAEVATVDAALEDFPGRIERDEWVQQARDFIKNGHKPVERVRKDRSGRTVLTEWSNGTTKLGTLGAGHTDDLKVVNGIGPKMESVLNSFGITSWEQLAAFSAADVEKVTKALDTFPGRIERDEWVAQAKDLVKRFRLTDPYHRPTRETYLNNSADDDPWS